MPGLGQHMCPIGNSDDVGAAYSNYPADLDGYPARTRDQLDDAPPPSPPQAVFELGIDGKINGCLDALPPSSSAVRQSLGTLNSTINQLPIEVIHQILENIFYDPTSDMYTALRTLRACLLISRHLYPAVLQYLFRHIPIASPIAFENFRLEVIEHKFKGALVRTLDFSGFSVVGLRRSATDNDTIQMVTSYTIANVLDYTPNLQEFIASEHVQQNLEATVVRKLFSGDLPYLQALDFCGAFGSQFVNAMVETLDLYIDDDLIIPHCLPPLERLSFHGCPTLPARVFSKLLPHLHHLNRLDLTHTKVTSEALLALSPRARLTHLHVGHTGFVSGSALLSFLLYHPAARTLRKFSVRFPAELAHPIEESDISLFLSALPRGMQCLDLGGISVNDEHLHLLPPKLRELSLYRTQITPDGVNYLIKEFPSLFYLELELPIAKKINSMWKTHPNLFVCTNNIKIVEASGGNVHCFPEVMNILPGWHFLHGASRRGWFIRTDEYDRLDALTGPGKHVNIGWRSNKVQCARGRDDVRGIHWHYSYGK